MFCNTVILAIVNRSRSLYNTHSDRIEQNTLLAIFN